MGRRIDKQQQYEELLPEELYTHVRKNISIPKYMDAFLYKNNISLSKLVQNAINKRMREDQEQTIVKDVKKDFEEKTIRKKLHEEKKKNPNFEFELHRAKFLLSEFFNAFDQEDFQISNEKKQHIFTDFPEMYVDIIKFEKWYHHNEQKYESIKEKYENPVERLIMIKKHYL